MTALDVVVDALVVMLVSAKTEPDLYRKLNTLRNNTSSQWLLLKTPQWVGDRLVAVVARERKRGE